MDLSIHSGFGQRKAPVTTRAHYRDGTCRIIRYTFTDYIGSQLEITHFEHGYFPPRQVEYTIDADVVLP